MPVRCVVCGGESNTVVWREQEYEGRACRCGTMYTSPEPAPGVVDVTRDAHAGAFYSTYAEMKARWIRRQQAGRLLEIGCGEGHFLAAAKSAGYTVSGVEPEPQRASRAIDRLGVEVRCAMLENLEWPGAQFDVVYHCDMLSHFPEPVAALRKMSSLLAPNGILAFEVGTLGGIHPFWFRWVGCLGLPDHRWFYSEESLRQLLANAGMRIVGMRRFGLAPAVALYRSRVLAGKLWRSLLPRRQAATAATAYVARDRTATRDAAYEKVEQFFRYRVGAVAPRIGPATWLVACRPAAGREMKSVENNK